MDITLVIPTFNRAHTLARAVQSALEQDCRPAQIIVVDDASTDTTHRVLEPWVDQLEFIQLPSNRGVSHARNVGISKARHEWIALLDSDDAWLPQKLKRQVEAIYDDPDVRAVHTDEIWIRNGIRVNPRNRHRKPHGRVYTDCLPLCCVSPSSVLLHREVFDICGLFDEALPACEDYDLWLRVFSRYPLALVPDALVVKYGGHDDQLSRKHWGMDRFRVRSLAKLLTSEYLGEQERLLTRQMLHQKCKVLIKGAIKRGNQSLIGECQSLQAQFPLERQS